MFSGRTVFVVAFSANLFLQSTSIGENQFIPCISNASCSSDLPGSICLEEQCVCMVKDGCKLQKVRSASKRIGDGCLMHEDCLVENSECSGGICECKRDWSPTHNKKQCIRIVPKPLGSQCEDDSQCSILKAECINNACQCPSNMYSKDGICYQKKALGEPCSESDSCNTFNSICLEGVCRCKSDFIPYENDCLQLEREINGSPCYDNIQCTSVFGKETECSNNKCACKEGYEYQWEFKKCIPADSKSSAPKHRYQLIIVILNLVTILHYY